MARSLANHFWEFDWNCSILGGHPRTTRRSVELIMAWFRITEGRALLLTRGLQGRSCRLPIVVWDTESSCKCRQQLPNCSSCSRRSTSRCSFWPAGAITGLLSSNYQDPVRICKHLPQPDFANYSRWSSRPHEGNHRVPNFDPADLRSSWRTLRCFFACLRLASFCPRIECPSPGIFSSTPSPPSPHPGLSPRKLCDDSAGFPGFYESSRSFQFWFTL